MKHLVYATTNPGKFAEVDKLFSEHSLTIHSPNEFGVTLDVDETGETLGENACLKAESFLDALPTDCVVIGDDTGVEIDALGGEPGIKVRRWKGYQMTDQEIVDHCLERLQGVPADKRTAQFRTVIAVAMRGKPTKLFDGTHRFVISTQPLPAREPGFPFRSLYLGKKSPTPTHRTQAITAALPYLRQLISQG
jgi:XTP/dITP diphosphohydrolase